MESIFASWNPGVSPVKIHDMKPGSKWKVFVTFIAIGTLFTMWIIYHPCITNNFTCPANSEIYISLTPKYKIEHSWFTRNMNLREDESEANYMAFNKEQNLAKAEQQNAVKPKSVLIEQYAFAESLSNKSQRFSTTARPFNGLYSFKDLTCAPLRPEALLYNRIFKTASSSMSGYIKDLSPLLNFTVDISTTEDWYNTGDSFPYPDIIERHVMRSEYRIAFIAHFFFRRFLRIPKSFTYINIVREPIERIISHYKYMRTTMRPTLRIREMKRAGLWNETLLDCVLNEHRGCESNVMTRFFCGVKPFCKTGSKRALNLAKSNIKRYYAAIGLQENLHLFLEVLKKRLPGYFEVPFNITLPYVKYNSKKINNRIQESTLNIIRKRNIADIKLYKFLTSRFFSQVKQCNLKNSR